MKWLCPRAFLTERKYSHENIVQAFKTGHFDARRHLRQTSTSAAARRRLFPTNHVR
jgi:hypothetical protein